METFIILIVVMVSWLDTSDKTKKNIYFKYIWFIVSNCALVKLFFKILFANSNIQIF